MHIRFSDVKGHCSPRSESALGFRAVDHSRKQDDVMVRTDVGSITTVRNRIPRFQRQRHCEANQEHLLSTELPSHSHWISVSPSFRTFKRLFQNKYRAQCDLY